ncbi:hypothetical protein N9Q14_01485 [Pseudomonadales bacterium]|nr:hypothetical protein [Pseudomonadales bacterium]
MGWHKSFVSNKVVMFTSSECMSKKNERTVALKKVKELCKEFGFTAGMLKSALAEGRKPKE